MGAAFGVKVIKPAEFEHVTLVAVTSPDAILVTTAEFAETRLFVMKYDDDPADKTTIPPHMLVVVAVPAAVIALLLNRSGLICFPNRVEPLKKNIPDRPALKSQEMALQYPAVTVFTRIFVCARTPLFVF